jgi:hypothetical protein
MTHAAVAKIPIFSVLPAQPIVAQGHRTNNIIGRNFKHVKKKTQPTMRTMDELFGC